MERIFLLQKQQHIYDKFSPDGRMGGKILAGLFVSIASSSTNVISFKNSSIIYKGGPQSRIYS